MNTAALTKCHWQEGCWQCSHSSWAGRRCLNRATCYTSLVCRACPRRRSPALSLPPEPLPAPPVRRTRNALSLLHRATLLFRRAQTRLCQRAHARLCPRLPVPGARYRPRSPPRLRRGVDCPRARWLGEPTKKQRPAPTACRSLVWGEPSDTQAGQPLLAISHIAQRRLIPPPLGAHLDP